MTPPATTPPELLCDHCGYDLRAHPPDALCPECGTPIAESIRVSTIPRRPLWRDSDPRWRRRMLAGAWVLVFLPLMNVLTTLDWASSVPVPTVLSVRGSVRTLDDTFASYGTVFPSLIFCIGMVLLFSRERGRRAGRLDWTRRWGVICSYVVLLLSTAQILIIAALVVVDIAAIFLSMPLKYQPAVTHLFIQVGAGYLGHGPYPWPIVGVVLVSFSAITVLLACLPLFDALRSSGSKRLAAILLAPLALFALMYLAQSGLYCFRVSILSPFNFSNYGVYFCPETLAQPLADRSAASFSSPPALSDVIVEDAKWCIVFTIAVWLTIAQFTAWWQRTKPSAPSRAAATVPPTEFDEPK